MSESPITNDDDLDREQPARPLQSSSRRRPPTLSRRRKWIYRLVALFLSLLLTLTLVEFGLRIITPGSDANLFVYQRSSIRNKVMRPNVRAVVYGVPFETNENGFRARRAYTTEKEPDIKRIVAIGDSFTACAGVAFEAIFTTRLEKELQAACPEFRLEVYNLAVGGHQILHHVATMREVASGYDPNLVLLFLYPSNDFNAHTYHDEREFIEQHADGDDQLTLPPLDRGLVRSLYITRAWGSQVQYAMRRIGVFDRMLGPSNYERLLQSFERRTPNWKENADALADFAQLSRESGVSCIVYLLPTNYGTYEMQEPLYRLAEEACRDAGLTVVSLLGRFAESGSAPTDFQINLIDGHPNAEYGALVSKFVFDDLKQRGQVAALREQIP
ncbi:MAG: SGNH/GDSL hydrolase family protein [Planctomycetota bacterium]|nr:SGNH/GDSL hydrolase family protein [Planctomycetota bacterium]